MKGNRKLFWIGMLGAGIWVFIWMRRHLGENGKQQQAPAGNRPRSSAQAEGSATTAAVQKATTPLPTPETLAEPDDLEEINGIGPTYARRLRAAGIQTFSDLAALSPKEARERANARPWQADTAAWIAQAKERVGS